MESTLFVFGAFNTNTNIQHKSKTVALSLHNTYAVVRTVLYEKEAEVQLRLV